MYATMELATHVSLLLILFSGLKKISFFAVPELDHPNFMPFTFHFVEDPATSSWGGERESLEQLLRLKFCTDSAPKKDINGGKTIWEDPEHWKKEAVKLLWDEEEDHTVSLLWHMMG